MKKTKLIVLRGPSGSGKSSVAKAVRDLYVTEGKKMAYVEQDHFRRIVLKERDAVGGFNIQFIKESVLFLLKNQYDVILEGIFDKRRYEEMFEELILLHPTHNYFFYFDISFEETLKRHDTKSSRNDYGESEMRSWYKYKDLLQCVEENIVSEKNSIEETMTFIQSVSDLKNNKEK